MNYFTWAGLEPATMQFCEQNIDSWFVQPANTWSNLAYIIIGIWLYFKFNKEDKNNVISLLPIIVILIGLSSFLYHASNTFLFQVFDLSALFLFSSLLLSINFTRLFDLKKKQSYFLFGLFF